MEWTPTIGRRYVKLLADSYEAVVSVDLVMSYSSSSLAHRLQVVLEQDTSSPEVQLECNAEELKEVVSVLRQVCPEQNWHHNTDSQWHGMQICMYSTVWRKRR
jgi:hypothetical protein